MAYSYDDEGPKETVTFEYGALQMFYGKQKPDGGIERVIKGGWNRVRNVKDQTPAPDIK